jgi:choline dehydrogenase-like flavoprotein|tara:strand:- start:612 stop:2318 length:1707 start_codon:yes stop_codon:yes gene_type:complete
MENNFDAIVVGTGVSGGWAAKELTEKGLKTLVLERGRMIKHIDDYHTANINPWDFEGGNTITQDARKKQPKQSRTGYVNREDSRHFFVNDLEHPYNDDANKFNWIRGYHVGGRSITWGRHTYRLSDLDFEANLKDGIATDWPIRYKDISPWYDYVEQYIGVQGRSEGLSHFPDGKFLKPFELNVLEKHMRERISKNFSDGRILSNARTAHVTEGTKPGLGRVACQYRNRCMRGCPYGAYFSSNSSTLPAAEATGNMTLMPNSIVHEIIYDDDNKKAKGVRVIDTINKQSYDYFAKVIFLCSSTVASTSILIQSKSNRFPNGLGNDSGELGHNIMDHHFQVGASGKFNGFKNKTTYGRKPAGYYIPRFRNIGGVTNRKDFIRGYGYQGGANRGFMSIGDSKEEMVSYGPRLKEIIVQPNEWTASMGAFGEILPYHDNNMELDYNKKDKWGLPTVTFNATIRENEISMRKDMKEQAEEMLEKSGFTNVSGHESKYTFGNGIHEMGTARMGHDPKTSVLNKFNQVHSVKNVYVTDGACMTSSGCQNPSITYMALTARAANHAVDELKKQNI